MDSVLNLIWVAIAMAVVGFIGLTLVFGPLVSQITTIMP